MVQRSREWLTILLIGLLPLHALLVTILTKMLLGAGNAPLPLLALWKEALLAVILILALIEIAQQKKKGLKEFFAPDKLDVCILALLLLSVVVGVFTQEYWKQYLLGFKYDFVPLLAFMILRRVPWTERCLELLIKVILWVGGAVALYGFLGMALPMEYFRALGYSDLHSLYLPGGPLAAFQQLGDSGLRRIQSTLSGPNQLGL